MNLSVTNRIGRAMIASALIAAAVVIGTATSPAGVVSAAGTPDIVLTKSMPAEVLFGEVIPVTLTVTNPTPDPGYNLTVNDILPVGISYVAGSAAPLPDPIEIVRPGGTTALVWLNIADTLPGTTVSVNFEVEVDRVLFDAGDTVTNTANAYANNTTNIRQIPDVDPATGAITADFTGSSEGATASTELLPFEILKVEPSAEDELLRGVHDHRTVYTLTVNNNLVNPTDDFRIVDFVPAGIEFLGCGNVDNTTTGEEYSAKGPLNTTPVAGLTERCLTPSSVTTVTTDPDGIGPMPSGVYTRVEWNNAALTSAPVNSALAPLAGDLAATESFTIQYVAAIPLFANAMFPAGPAVDPTANLDNNTGALTIERDGAEQQFTNYVVANGSYRNNQTIAVPSDADAIEFVIAEDVSIHKTGPSALFQQTDAVQYTLFVEGSEYVQRTTDIVVRDFLPATLDFVSAVPAPEGPGVVQADGRLLLTWTLPAFTAPNQDRTITLNATVRDTFRGTGTPVSSNDDFVNTTDLVTDATTIIDAVLTEETNTVQDESAWEQFASGPTILKEVARPPGGAIASCGNGSTLDFVDLQPPTGEVYRPGDIVCWRLTVDFPASLDTLGPIVDDFLPAGFTYVDARLGANDTMPVGATAITPFPGGVTFDMTDVDVGGLTFEAIVETRITEPNAAQPGDLLNNLMKFRYNNTAGGVFQFRDDAIVEWSEPILALDKSVVTVNGGAPSGNPVAVNEGDTVVYNVAVTNSGTETALDATVRDILPTQLSCADVSAISNGGTCSAGVINWTTTSNLDLTPGQTITLSYTVVVRDGVTPGITMTNRAGVRDYRGATNNATPFTYVPANNIDGSLVPNTVRADDTQAIRTRVPLVSKTRTTEIDAATDATQTGNAGANQATIGERISYRVEVSVPAGTSVTNATITDIIDGGNPLTGEKNLVASSVAATVNGSPIVVGPAVPGAFRLTVNDAGNSWTVTPPNPYNVANGVSGDLVVVTFDAIVNDVASNTRGTSTGNTVNLQYTNAVGVQTASSSVGTTIVEPNIVLTKTENDVDNIATANQPVTYTISIVNNSAPGSVSTANDTTVIDTVPNALVVLEGPGDPAEDGDTLPSGGIWNAPVTVGGPSTITWTIARIAPGATVTRTYDAVLRTDVIASAVITNVAVARTSSYPGTPPTPAGEPAPAERSPSSPNGGAGTGYFTQDDAVLNAVRLTATKTGGPTPRTIGEPISYTITATIPAGIVANDVTVIDALPAGFVYVDTTSITCAQGAGACSPNITEAGTLELGPTAGRLAWFIGDLPTSATADRTVTIVYRGYVSSNASIGDATTLTNGAAIYWNLSNELGTPTAPPTPGDFDESSPFQTVTIGVDEPRLVIDKDVTGQVADLDQRRAKPGDTLTFTVAVTNSGTSAAYDVVVSDTPDARLTGYTFAPVVGVVNTDAVPSDGSLAWTIAGPIAPGASVTLTYTLTVPASFNSAQENPTGPELLNTADIPAYFGVPAVDRTLPSTEYREYGVGPHDVTPDTVRIELDLASIGDFVWLDADGNGAFNAGDRRLGGVPVRVTYHGPDGNIATTADNEVFDTVTLADGTYLVEDLPGGTYTVDVDEVALAVLVGGLTPSYDLDGTVVSPNGIWSGALGENEDKRDVDFGYTGTGAIGDTIWFDANADGVQNALPGNTEAGIAGVTVNVTWAGPDGNLSTTADNVVYTAVTNANGTYLVERLPAGNYSVAVDTATLPVGYLNVTDPDTPLAPNNASVLTLDPAERDLVQDFGYRGNGSIGDRIWLDQNGNGVQDPAEPGLVGVTVILTSFGPDGVAGGTDDSTFTTITGVNGAYLFSGLPPGEYNVVVGPGLPATVTNTGDPQGNGDSASRVTLALNENNVVQDFGYDAASVLGDFVWWDLDRDGVQDVGEPGLPGVTVRATGPNGVVLTTTTAADGSYTFTDIPDGNWTVAVTGGVPVDFTPTFDADSGTTSPNQSSTVNLVTSNLLQDFGYAGTASIGDRLWLDTDRDGVQDGGEPGVENVTITLTWYGPNGIPGGGDDVVLTTVTNDTGNYLFPGLPAGNFNVVVDTTDPDYPVGVSLTFDRDNGLVSPDGITPVTLTSGANVRDVDFGVAGGGAIGDTVWYDRNGDGVKTVDEPGIGGAEVTLVYFGEDGLEGTLDDETFTDTTDPDGAYLFPGLPQGLFRVTVDPNTLPAGLRGQTFDANGPLDSTSVVTLAPGALVDLNQDFGYRGVGQIGNTVYFDRDGNGTQGADEPGLPGQSVTLVWNSPDGPRTFVTSTGPDGTYLFDRLPDGDFTVTVTGPIATIATNTGDPDGGNNSTSAVTLTGGSSNLDQDFGYRGDNRIGDRVWWDQNADGVDDAGEPGIGGVTVAATWFGPDGVAGTPDDVTLTSTTTSADGSYSFEGLPDGNYVVALGAGIPMGLDRATFDADDGTVTPNNRSILTGLGVGVATPVANLDQDFGVAGSGTIGDTIWLDLDGDGILDPGEPGIPGAQVTLTWFGPDNTAGGGDDVVLPVQTTGPDGTYLFEHLLAGNFRVDVADIPAGLAPTADPDLGADSSSELSLATGATNLDQDFGYVGTASVGDTIWLDLDKDGVQDPGEPGLPGVTVMVRSGGADGILNTADDLVVRIDTNAAGVYVVEGLPAGTTVVSYDVTDLGVGLVPRIDLDGGDLTTTTVVLATGDNVRNVDFGVVGTATVSGTVWIDIDNDGVKDANEVGIPNVTVNVTWQGPNGPIVIPVVTDANGNWSIPDAPAGVYTAVVDAATLPPGLVRTTPSSTSTTVPPGGSGSVQHGFVPPGSIGDRIWNDTDRDGVQDAGETGVAGVTIVLRDAAGAVVATAVTDASGNYRFDGLPPATYTVEVDTSTLPTGVTIVSDPDGINDGRNTITLSAGQRIDTVDFGVASREGALPATGGEIVRMLLLAGLLLALGAMIVSGSRRRRTANV
jgi:uncharacterized repeat protein (TIGR01451 family)/fimbrial isopeptide formation D2 family protein/LPXTG-motif cell wall-anchored protein